MKILPMLCLAAVAALAQDRGPGGMSFIRMSPILNAADTDQNGVVSAAEIAGSPDQLRKLDKNGDGKLSREEAGLQMQFGRGGRGGEGGGRGGPGGDGGDEPPAPAPSAAELTDTLMVFDSNKNGQLEKSEVPERMQGIFERGDTNHDGILTRDEIVKLAEANRQQAGGGGRGEGRGPDQFDVAFNALDTDHDGEISAEEINRAATSLKTLDKNGDGQITNDEVTPAFGGRGFGRGRGPDQ
jgi:Ca2+-binding EF-hand superfamily protein